MVAFGTVPPRVLKIIHEVKPGFTNYQPKKLLKTSKTRFYKLPVTRFEFSKKKIWQKQKNHKILKKLNFSKNSDFFQILKKLVKFASKNCERKLQAKLASKNCKQKLQAEIASKIWIQNKANNEATKPKSNSYLFFYYYFLFFWPEPTYDSAFGW